ncbi:hypothetical protein B0H21DRAFT_748865 [Amylocystis lapponica]|nr:hypothetical protein B0H21DRAFT_748865 [Amylocystis lapponica]
MRDGTVYFGVWLAVNILKAIFSVPTIIDNALNNILVIIPQILISHFMLNLREVYNGSSPMSLSSMASIDFASRLTGNMGAALGHSGLSLMDSHTDDVPEPFIISNDPLAVGLIPNLDVQDIELSLIREEPHGVEVGGSLNNVASGSGSQV